MLAFPEQPYLGGKARDGEKCGQSGHSDRCSDPTQKGGSGLHRWARRGPLPASCPQPQQEEKKGHWCLSSPLRHSRVKSPVPGYDFCISCNQQKFNKAKQRNRKKKGKQNCQYLPIPTKQNKTRSLLGPRSPTNT